MCEKRTRRIKKESLLARQARRLQRIQRLSTTPTDNENNTVANPCPASTADKTAQNKAIIELAWKTIVLMHKNRLIQQKIIALKKETSEFLITVMNNPENRRRYLENLRLHGIPNGLMEITEIDTPLKIDPPRT